MTFKVGEVASSKDKARSLCVYIREKLFKGSCTLTTGGGEGKSLLFSVKSSTLMVADMITSFNGWPCYEVKEEGGGGI